MEEDSEERHLKHHSELNKSLQEWHTHEYQLQMTEEKTHTNEEQLKQSSTTEVRLGVEVQVDVNK